MITPISCDDVILEQDVYSFAHFIVHRLCVYWSCDQRIFEGIILQCSLPMRVSVNAGGIIDSVDDIWEAEGGYEPFGFSQSASTAPTFGGHYTTRTHLLAASLGEAGGDAQETGSSFATLYGAGCRSVSFLQALLHEIARRSDVVAFFQHLCEDIRVESLTEESVGIADLSARIVEPFCKRLEAAIAEGIIPHILLYTLRALAAATANPMRQRKGSNLLVTPYQFMCDCIIPHMVATVMKKNAKLEKIYGISLAAEPMFMILDRVSDLLRICFDQSVDKQRIQICLSDQAAISRSKWFIGRCSAFATVALLDHFFPGSNDCVCICFFQIYVACREREATCGVCS